ncbi:phosphosulfolactate synthase [Marininema halotolerans]|uniref:Phosphosulfolactate synthase n=2 Tax=Marininema halotolerans TaxID=1155944 RepID=A0A1I6QQS5_9BACL|nr:phosphosulfolactate synthase [Marininema halotolerans]
MDSCMEISWNASLIDPTHSRQSKPRTTTGLTMVLDKGLGLTAFRDLLQLASAYVDFIKLGFGTTGITPVPILQKKIEIASQYHTYLYPGGTFFEVAYTQGKTSEYFYTLKRLGFDWVEISDGTVSIPESDRYTLIEEAQAHSLRVITEIGKKAKHSITPIHQLTHLFKQDRKHGAEFVIIEGRESGCDVGIYDDCGMMDTSYVHQVCSFIDHRYLWWECPQISQQIELLHLLGNDVNIGNVAVPDILSLESLRRGLRSDTLSTMTSLKKDPVL